VTAFGEVARGHALTRAGALPGDRVLVTGRLGGAALGLALLESGNAAAAPARPFVRRQVRPRPPLGVGPRLARLGGITAAIDISDGLAQDAGHVARESGVGIDLWLERLPLARGLRARCEALERDPLELAVWGGEDYELIFFARPRRHSVAALARRLGVQVTEIGSVRRGRGVRTLMDGRATPIAGHGWDHFKAPAEAAEE
jgi:thiamine-monophosphate kinase